MHSTSLHFGRMRKTAVAYTACNTVVMKEWVSVNVASSLLEPTLYHLENFYPLCRSWETHCISVGFRTKWFQQPRCLLSSFLLFLCTFLFFSILGGDWISLSVIFIYIFIYLHSLCLENFFFLKVLKPDLTGNLEDFSLTTGLKVIKIWVA